jgi:hypothetical protein
MQRQVDITNEVRYELQGFGTLLTRRVLVGQHLQKITNLYNNTACGYSDRWKVRPRPGTTKTPFFFA